MFLAKVVIILELCTRLVQSFQVTISVVKEAAKKKNIYNADLGKYLGK